MLKKIILLLALIGAMAVLAAADQEKGLTFVGKIEEVALKTNMTPLGAMEKFLVIKLDAKPKIDFRITAKDAARYKIIDTAQPSAVLTPGQVKGVGWKVRLTCDKKVVLGGESNYLVTNLEKMD